MDYLKYVYLFLMVTLGGGGSYIIFYKQPNEITLHTKEIADRTATKTGLQNDVATLTKEKDVLSKEMTKDQAALLVALLAQVQIRQQENWVRITLEVTPQMLAAAAQH